MTEIADALGCGLSGVRIWAAWLVSLLSPRECNQTGPNLTAQNIQRTGQACTVLLAVATLGLCRESP